MFYLVGGSIERGKFEALVWGWSKEGRMLCGRFIYHLPSSFNPPYLRAGHELGEAVEVPLPEELRREVEHHAGGADLCSSAEGLIGV